ncbi:MAG: DUF4870 domain-containing protein [Spirulinaceae cyanobacterium SM2_1_0]|nr:DUF4870 domain-containing protein [Spirulinaceae cyanobacterium SM2_1_0]
MEPQDERTWATFCHVASLLWIVLIPLSFFGLPVPPFLNLPGPLIVWLARRDRSRLVDVHGRESMNFQISLTIYGLVLLLLGLAITAVFLVLGLLYGSQSGGQRDAAVLVGLLFAFAGGTLWIIIQLLLALINLILVIVAAFSASNGQEFRYPLTIRLLPPPR